MLNCKKTKNTLGIFGCCPPPYGGVSIHIERTLPYLNKNNIQYNIYDFTRNENKKIDNITYIKHSILWTIKYLINPKDKIIHVHYSNPFCWFLYSFLSYRKITTILTVHSRTAEVYLSSKNPIIRTIVKIALHNYTRIQVAHTEFKNVLLKNNIDEAKIEFVPSFIPPQILDEDVRRINKKIESFISTHNPIISANAYKLVFYNDEDLYGFDLCIELCNALKKDNQEVGMILCIGTLDNIEYYNHLISVIKEYELEDNILFIIGEKLYPILMKTDIFIRPTNTDADAISIHEALCFGKIAIASDIVLRPNKCYLFHNRDVGDLIKVTKEILLMRHEKNPSQEQLNEYGVNKEIRYYLSKLK